MLLLQQFVRAAFARPGNDQTRHTYPLIIDELQVFIGKTKVAEYEKAILLRALDQAGGVKKRAASGYGDNAANRAPIDTMTGLEIFLSQAGYEVLIAGTGDEALAVAAAHAGPIPLLLTDLVMPGMSGKQLAERFRTERPEGRVLYMSGYFDEDVTGTGVLDAGLAFLPKPFSRDELLLHVREVLGAALAEPDRLANRRGVA